MRNKNKILNGLDKLAILFYTLGPEQGKKLLSNLDEQSISSIGRKLKEMGKIEPETLSAVMEEYLALHTSDDPMMRVNKKEVRALLEDTMQDDELESVLSRMNDEPKLNVWEKLSKIKPEMVAAYISDEHPQTIALILANLAKTDTEAASRVIPILPEAIQINVVFRMSQIESVPEELIGDIERTLEKILEESTGSAGLSFNGMEGVVGILKRLDKTVSKPILENLKEKDDELFKQVDRLMLTFEELILLDDRDVQTVLKNIDPEDLIKALKGADEETKEMFLKNMSKRAAETLKEDMEVMGPVKVADVEAASQAILKVVRRLDDEEEITLNTGDY